MNKCLVVSLLFSLIFINTSFGSGENISQEINILKYDTVKSKGSFIKGVSIDFYFSRIRYQANRTLRMPDFKKLKEATDLNLGFSYNSDLFKSSSFTCLLSLYYEQGQYSYTEESNTGEIQNYNLQVKGFVQPISLMYIKSIFKDIDLTSNIGFTNTFNINSTLNYYAYEEEDGLINFTEVERQKNDFYQLGFHFGIGIKIKSVQSQIQWTRSGNSQTKNQYFQLVTRIYAF